MLIVAAFEAAVALLIIRWLLGKKTGEPFSRKTSMKIVLLGGASAIIIMIASIFVQSS